MLDGGVDVSKDRIHTSCGPVHIAGFRRERVAGAAWEHRLILSSKHYVKEQTPTECLELLSEESMSLCCVVGVLPVRLLLGYPAGFPGRVLPVTGFGSDPKAAGFFWPGTRVLGYPGTRFATCSHSQSSLTISLETLRTHNRSSAT